MALVASAANATTVSQRFGPAVSAVSSLEPAMWALGDRAYWNKFPGATFFPHFHPGIDEFAKEGTAIIARENGTVDLAGYANKTSGWVVRVKIRDGISRYGANHCSKILVKVGDRVVKGQTIALMGRSGLTTGVHTHAYVEIYEPGIGWVCYNPAVFVPGGRLANDARIQSLSGPQPKPADLPPPKPSVGKLAFLKGPGINIRTTPDLDVGGLNLYATSVKTGPGPGGEGIYRRSDGVRIGFVSSAFGYFGDVTTDDGVWAKVGGFGKTLYVYKPLVNIK